ncbi:hypothetical protein [Nocardia brasiliensis]|uniref:hypothetical protein n=1 Tax=Nocardia brasiliensis TaxID=37326 RepID=UPI003D917076
MNANYIPAYHPLQLLVRNEYDTHWLAYGQFDTIDALTAHIKDSRITKVRKRIVHVTMRETPAIGIPRYRMTTIWEGTRLPRTMGTAFPVDDPDHPRNYDTTTPPRPIGRARNPPPHPRTQPSTRLPR